MRWPGPCTAWVGVEVGGARPTFEAQGVRSELRLLLRKSGPAAPSVQFSSVTVRLLATRWTAARQASLSITNSRSLLKLVSIESVMPSHQLILCRPLLLQHLSPGECGSLFSPLCPLPGWLGPEWNRGAGGTESRLESQSPSSCGPGVCAGGCGGPGSAPPGAGFSFLTCPHLTVEFPVILNCLSSSRA